MTRSIPLLAVAMVGVCCIVGAPSLQADLIGPTRTLDAPAETTGLLSVFSDPPGLPVHLDGSPIGETVIQGLPVPSGPHALKVGPHVTQINVPSGRSVRLSLFQGEFISVPERPPAEPSPGARTAPEAPRPPSSPPQKRGDALNPPSPIYFPFNPRGPIY